MLDPVEGALFAIPRPGRLAALLNVEYNARAKMELEVKIDPEPIVISCQRVE